RQFRVYGTLQREAPQDLADLCVYKVWCADGFITAYASCQRIAGLAALTQQHVHHNGCVDDYQRSERSALTASAGVSFSSGRCLISRRLKTSSAGGASTALSISLSR